MSKHRDHYRKLRAAEASAYAHWSTAANALAAITAKRAAHAAAHATTPRERHGWDRLHIAAIEEEQNAFERWQNACNKLDDYEASFSHP